MIIWNEFEKTEVMIKKFIVEIGGLAKLYPLFSKIKLDYTFATFNIFDMYHRPKRQYTMCVSVQPRTMNAQQ